MEDLIKKINKYCNVNRSYEYIKTGVSLIDCFLSGNVKIDKSIGGFLRGKLYSFSGGAGVGKTTLLLYLCKKLCENGNNVFFIDVEDGINDKFLLNVGLDKYYTNDIEKFNNDNYRFFVANPSTYGETIDLVKDVLSIRKVDFIVVDSIKHLLTDNALNSNSEDVEGLLLDKRIESVFFPLFKNLAKKYNLVICFIQQVRIKRKGMFYVVDESGGNAFLHTIDCRYLLKAKEEIEYDVKNNEGVMVKKVIGNVVEIITKKSRFGMYNLTIPILNGRGISFIYYYYRILKNNGFIVLNKGGIYVINFGEFKDVKVKGERSVYDFINNNFDVIENFLIENNLLVIEKSEEENEVV